MPSTLYRDLRARDLLTPKLGSVTVADVREAFLDDFQSPYSLCQPERPNSKGVVTATVAMVIMQPAKGIMEVAPLPAQNRVFTRYSLTEEPVLLAEAAE